MARRNRPQGPAQPAPQGECCELSAFQAPPVAKGAGGGCTPKGGHPGESSAWTTPTLHRSASGRDHAQRPPHLCPVGTLQARRPGLAAVPSDEHATLGKTVKFCRRACTAVP